MADLPLLLLRFAHYCVLLGLFGMAAFRATAIARQAVGGEIAFPARSAAGLAILGLVLSTALMLVSIASMMGQSIVSLERDLVATMIGSTSGGSAYLVRTALLVLTIGALILARRSLHLAVLLSGAAVMTLSWSGHAAATEGMPGLAHRLNNGLHLLAAGLWLGAIGWFLHLVVKAHRQPAQFAPEPLLAAMHRFAPFGVILVGLVAVTGLINSHMIFGLENAGSVLATEYGWLLVGKIFLVGLMLVCGARNAFVGRRDIEMSRAGTSALVALRISLLAELTFAVMVVGVVAILGMASPTE